MTRFAIKPAGAKEAPVAAPAPVYESDDLRVLKLTALGPYSNNAFILVDKASNQSAIIDAVPQMDQILAAAAGTEISMVLFTHSHPDHIDSFDALREKITGPFHMHPDEPWADHSRIDVALQGGESIQLGETTLEVIHTPGHTPGGLCYYHAPYCVVGDTLFPGGPGHSTSNENLQTLIGSITERLHTLPADTIILNGHGDETTIGASREEYARFATKEHDADLHGDVLWEQG